MKRSYLFLATGFEEVEAIAPVDALRRAGMEVTVVAINKERLVTGANGITVAADEVLAGVNLEDADWLICPGGMPGATNLRANEVLCEALKAHYDKGGRIAAICASPAVVLATLGILKGKKATAYPGFEEQLKEAGATHVEGRVVVDGNIITANGPSSALPFAYAIIKETLGEEKADEIASGMLYK